jgi:hypothetical protein
MGNGIYGGRAKHSGSTGERVARRIDSVEAWYFSKQDTRLGYGDNRLIAVGETHSVQGPLIPYENALYASVRIIDALLRTPLVPGAQYSTRWLYRVEMEGEIIIDKHEICATKRTYLAKIEMTEILSD